MPAEWAPLARKYIAERRGEFLAMAHRAAADADIAGMLLAWGQEDLLQVDSLAPAVAERLRHAGRTDEASTAVLVHRDCRASLVEHIRHLPESVRNQALQVSLQACLEAREVAQRLNDRPCEARYLLFTAIGHLEARQLSAARNAYDDALAIYRQLDRAQPGAYTADVATTLNNLGDVLADLAVLETARAAYEEALAIYRGLDRAQPGAYPDSVAMTLNNLGNVLRDLRELGAARNAYEEALAIYRRLDQTQPGAHDRASLQDPQQPWQRAECPAGTRRCEERVR